MGRRAAIVGAGPAGLIAAEILSAHGWTVVIYDQMPSVGRKFLMAGRGGLNLTHSEPLAQFANRYDASDWARRLLAGFTPHDLVAWARGLGQETFVGSSGRVFPVAMKASPLLRAWMRRLDTQGVELRLRRRWTGWSADNSLTFEGPDGREQIRPDATILALGGGSWPNLGSDGTWTEILSKHGIPVLPLVASNCGVVIDWSAPFKDRFAGTPLNRIAVSAQGQRFRGEAMVTSYGLEGGAIYALSASLRNGLSLKGQPTALTIDLRPEVSETWLASRLEGPRRGESLSNLLRKRVGLAPVAINLLREQGADLRVYDPAVLARRIKNVSLNYYSMADISRAISTSGGVSRASLDADLRISGLESVYAAGEMIDWDAPTGGYLLQLCFSSGVHVARRICGL